MVATMRVVFPLLISFMLCGGALAGGYCADPDSDDTAPPAHADETYPASWFKGISLATTPAEMRAIGRQRGFLTGTFTFVGETVVAAVNLCRDGGVVARADFDRRGRMLRLGLKDQFFYDTPVFVRDFAEDVFKTYAVKTLETDDDVCFQDVTCFQGVSKYGEQFLIMRFGTGAELYVRPPARNED